MYFLLTRWQLRPPTRRLLQASSSANWHCWTMIGAVPRLWHVSPPRVSAERVAYRFVEHN